ncbi:MAG: glycosyltransferase family 4 protein [Planctomycetota bacterium]
MAKVHTKKVAFISSFLPRKCGIATFTSDLITNIEKTAKEDFEPLVVAMRSDSNLKYNDPVKFEIRQNVKNDYICAADYINFSHVDAVSVQHEFGLFGGDAGSYLNLLLKRLNAPIITTLHTVLNDPTPEYKKSLIELCNASQTVIVMNERGIDMLSNIYGIPGKKVMLIAHGIPDLPFVDNNYYKHKFGMEGRRTILTFGLLSKNKGIEVMLKAMPEIVKADPSVLYVVLGMTHPSVLKHDGESYRFSLQQIVKELGLTENVIFYNRFVSDEELNNFLCAADIYVTPYLNREQLTSGTLSFAVGTGKAVVSTPYWAAMELLSEGRGKITPFGDSKAMAQAIVEILKNDSLFYSLRRKAYDYSRTKTWPRIGEVYWKLFRKTSFPLRILAKPATGTKETTTGIHVPEPSLDHLKTLTDHTGLYQHAYFTVPNRHHGYCTDDNARAVITMAKYYAQYPEPEALRLFDIYLSFILYSQNNDGTVRNFMNFDRTWQRKEPLSDAFGRVLWALGVVMATPPTPLYLPTIKDFFDRSVRHIPKQSARSMAYSLIGMFDYLKQFPGASDIKRHMISAADSLVELYNKNSSSDWRWFENIMTYDNAILPCALFVAGMLFGEKYLDVAKSSCEFLLESTYKSDHFSFVGNAGWYKRGEVKAEFDQQPIEGASTVMMLRAAYEATGDSEFIKLQRKAFDWYLGNNDLNIPVYNFRTKGCHDALTRGGVNTNQGAESLLSFMLSQLEIIESDTAVENISASIDFSQSVTSPSDIPTQREQKRQFLPIKSVSQKTIPDQEIEEVH